MFSWHILGPLLRIGHHLKGEMKVYMINKMDFHYNQQLYKNHKCKHIKEKNVISFAARAPPLCSILTCYDTGLVGFCLTGSGQ